MPNKAQIGGGFVRTEQQKWEDAQRWERSWWLSNPNLYRSEIEKGNIVAGWMGIKSMPTKTVVDVGCGPFSLLQRVHTAASCAVDPIDYGPLELGYQVAGVTRLMCRGEDLVANLNGRVFDEAWIYNCLQHVEDPLAVLSQAMLVSSRVRLFEWVNIPPYTGHLHMLTKELLFRPFGESKWRADFQLVGFADGFGLNGEFYAGSFSPPATEDRIMDRTSPQENHDCHYH